MDAKKGLLALGAAGFAVGLLVLLASAGPGRLATPGVYLAYACAFAVPAFLTLRGHRWWAALAAAALLVPPFLTFFFGLLAILPGLAFLAAALLPPRSEARAPPAAGAP